MPAASVHRIDELIASFRCLCRDGFHQADLQKSDRQSGGARGDLPSDGHRCVPLPREPEPGLLRIGDCVVV